MGIWSRNFTSRDNVGMSPQNFGMSTPTKFVRAKTSKIRRDFWQLSPLSANTSGMDRHKRKSEKKHLINYNSSPIVRKRLEELWSTKKSQALMLGGSSYSDRHYSDKHYSDISKRSSSPSPVCFNIDADWGHCQRAAQHSAIASSRWRLHVPGTLCFRRLSL